MSVCISNSGEYSAHKLDSDFICNRCLAFGEEEAVTEIEALTEQHKFEMMRAKSAEAEVARLRDGAEKVRVQFGNGALDAKHAWEQLGHLLVRGAPDPKEGSGRG